jgi:hypothetical protein
VQQRPRRRVTFDFSFTRNPETAKDRKNLPFRVFALSTFRVKNSFISFSPNHLARTGHFSH